METNSEVSNKLLFTKKQLAAIIIPLMLEQILGVTVGMADTVMVSRVGEAAVSGVSLVDNINILLVNVFLSLSTGGAVIAAQAIGQQKKDRACKAANQLILSIVSMAVIMMMIALIGNRQILALIFGGVEKGVMDNAIVYFAITAVSYPFLALQGGCSALCRSMGNTKVTMYVSILVNIINISGNAFFLLVLGWNAAGVAMATLIARIVGAVIMFLVMCNKNKPIYITLPFSFRYDWDIIKSIMGIGIPTGLDNAIFQIGKILVQSLIVSFGTAAIAANAVVGVVAGCAYIPGNAVGITFLTVIGQTIGAGEYKAAKDYIKKLMGVAILSMAALNICIILGAKWLVGLYGLSAQGADMAHEVIVYHSVAAILCWSFAFALPNALRAADDAKYTMIISISSMWICRIGFSYLLGRYLGLGLLGVWIAMSLDWVCRALFFIFRIINGKWLKHHLKRNGEKELAHGSNGT